MIKAKDITAAAIILCLSLSACSQEPETAAQYAEEKEPQTQQTGLESRTDNEDLPLTFDIDTTRSVSISVGHSEPRLFEEKSVLTALILKINSLHLNRSEGADFDAFADMVAAQHAFLRVQATRRRLDAQFIAFQQRERAAQHAHLMLKNLKHLLKQAADVLLPHENRRDLPQHGYL